MLKLYVFFITLCLFLINFSSNAHSQYLNDNSASTTVIPNSYAALGGTGAFTGPFSTAARTYQWLINANQLTTMVGNNIISLAMRIPTSSVANWPTSDVTYSNFDIYIGPGRAPASKSLTFDSNFTGAKTLVRSGSLVIAANSYTFGGTPNAFGTAITFTTPYLYSGGNLLVELRHSGFTGTTRTNDALTTVTGGYGTDISACWTGSYTGTTGTTGNFCVIQLNDAVAPVELSSFTSSVRGNNVKLQWTTESELNNSGFDIERKCISPNQSEWVKISNVSGHGNSTEQHDYSFNDFSLPTAKYQYRLKQIDYNGSYEYFILGNEVEIGAPNNFTLSQNYPNPFNPSTKIDYSIPFESKVNLQVFDMLGREVANLVNNDLQKAGYYTIEFNATGSLSGTYFYKITATNGENKYTATKKMILIK